MEDNFIIICKNCGSHNVSVSGYDLGCISLKCNDCGFLYECGYYNESGETNSSQNFDWGKYK